MILKARGDHKTSPYRVWNFVRNDITLDFDLSIKWLSQFTLMGGIPYSKISKVEFSPKAEVLNTHHVYQIEYWFVDAFAV